MFIPLQKVMDKGMPFTEWSDTSGTDKGIGLLDSEGSIVQVEAGAIVFVPAGWVCSPVQMSKGEVKKSDVIHMISQPLFNVALHKALKPVLFKEICEWNEKHVGCSASTSESWVAVQSMWRTFVNAVSSEEAAVHEVLDFSGCGDSSPL